MTWIFVNISHWTFNLKGSVQLTNVCADVFATALVASSFKSPLSLSYEKKQPGSLLRLFWIRDV